jgi:hypothetical protein
MYFCNCKREYLKDRINELATKSRKKIIKNLYRGIYEFKTGFELRNSLVNDENGDRMLIRTF